MLTVAGMQVKLIELAVRHPLNITIQVASLASATPSVAYARFALSLTWVR